MAKRMTAEQAQAVIVARGLDTHAKALEARAQIDAAKWGEAEREPSRQMNRSRSHALLLNSVAVADVEHIDEELRAAAAALMTEDDKYQLRQGG